MGLLPIITTQHGHVLQIQNDIDFKLCQFHICDTAC
jgi:hypothetical protein